MIAHTSWHCWELHYVCLAGCRIFQSYTSASNRKTWVPVLNPVKTILLKLSCICLSLNWYFFISWFYFVVVYFVLWDKTSCRSSWPQGCCTISYDFEYVSCLHLSAAGVADVPRCAQCRCWGLDWGVLRASQALCQLKNTSANSLNVKHSASCLALWR